jgi:preprotein translocase subunit SecG
MTALEITLGIIITVIAAILVVCVLFQSGKEKSLSGSIAGSAEGFFSKNKIQTRDKILSRITTVLSVLFVALTLVAVIVIAALN